MKVKISIKSFLLQLILLAPLLNIYAQKEENDAIEQPYKPLIFKLDDSGEKYIRFMTWHQIWAEDDNLNESSSGFNMKIRRSRFLTYAQVSPRILILAHFGINSLTGSNADPIGDARDSDTPQLFLHGAWSEFKISENDALYVGAGLHYWNGLSRLTNASTLNFMTLDNYRQAWASLGLSDQFARHLGIYAKGKFGKLRYTLALNEPITNALGSSEEPEACSITYSGRELLGKNAGKVVTGYIDYQFIEQESNKLPYRVGTYMGKKTVFNLGAGFFSHPNGTVTTSIEGNYTGNNVNHFALDAFYDAPLGKGAVSAYAAYYNFDYGENYALGTTYGTGSSFYGHFGYVLPKFSEKVRFMPYLAYSTRDFEAFAETGNKFQFGGNFFLNGHNAKISFEYSSTLMNYTGLKPSRIDGLILQTHIFL